MSKVTFICGAYRSDSKTTNRGVGRVACPATYETVNYTLPPKGLEQRSEVSQMIRVGKVTVARWLTMKRPGALKAYMELGKRLYRLKGLMSLADGSIKPVLYYLGSDSAAYEKAVTLNDFVYLCQAEQSLDGQSLSKVKAGGLANVPLTCYALRDTNSTRPDCACVHDDMPHA